MFTVESNLCQNFYQNVYLVVVLIGLDIESRLTVGIVYIAVVIILGRCAR